MSTLATFRKILHAGSRVFRKPALEICLDCGSNKI
eukprot:SAG31_NODE_1468_length_8223_cov_37.850320_7_plen_35_part_00